ITTVYSFLFHVSAATCFYSLSLHDALPIFRGVSDDNDRAGPVVPAFQHAMVDERRRQALMAKLRMREEILNLPEVSPSRPGDGADRKSTRLNSSHVASTYAVFSLKK